MVEARDRTPPAGGRFAWGRLSLALVAAGAAGAAVWMALLLSLSLGSSPRTLAVGEEKPFGWFDPHLHVSLVEAGRTDTLPPGPSLPSNASNLLVVTLRYRSDAIRVRVRPGYLDAAVVAADGVLHEPVHVVPPEGARVLGDPRDWELDAGASATQQFVFALPANLRDPVVWVHDPHWMARLIPGSETSPLHRRAVFALP